MGVGERIVSIFASDALGRCSEAHDEVRTKEDGIVRLGFIEDCQIATGSPADGYFRLMPLPRRNPSMGHERVVKYCRQVAEPPLEMSFDAFSTQQVRYSPNRENLTGSSSIQATKCKNALEVTAENRW